MATYLSQADIALSRVSDILAAGGSQADIAAQITATLGGIVAPDLSGLPAIVAQLVNTVARSIASVLEQNEAKPTVNLAIVQASAKPIVFTGKDLARLQAARANAAHHAVNIAEWQALHPKK